MLSTVISRILYGVLSDDAGGYSKISIALLLSVLLLLITYFVYVSIKKREWSFIRSSLAFIIGVGGLLFVLILLR